VKHVVSAVLIATRVIVLTPAIGVLVVVVVVLRLKDLRPLRVLPRLLLPLRPRGLVVVARARVLTTVVSEVVVVF